MHGRVVLPPRPRHSPPAACSGTPAHAPCGTAPPPSGPPPWPASVAGPSLEAGQWVQTPAPTPSVLVGTSPSRKLFSVLSNTHFFHPSKLPAPQLRLQYPWVFLRTQTPLSPASEFSLRALGQERGGSLFLASATFSAARFSAWRSCWIPWD